MNHEERRQLREAIAASSAIHRRLLRRVSWAAFPFGLAAVLFNSPVAFGLVIASIVAFWVWQHRHFGRVKGMLAQMLCTTAYAKNRGIQPDNIT